MAKEKSLLQMVLSTKANGTWAMHTVKVNSRMNRETFMKGSGLVTCAMGEVSLALTLEVNMRGSGTEMHKRE